MSYLCKICTLINVFVGKLPKRQYVRLVQTHKETLYLEVQNEQTLDELSEKLIKVQELKPEIKKSLTDEEKRLMYNQFLLQDPNTWPSKELEEKLYKEVKKKSTDVKNQIEDERMQIHELIELGEKGLTLLKQNIDDLENKNKEISEKLEKAENILKNYKDKMSVFGEDENGSSLSDIKQKKAEKLQKLEREIAKGKETQEILIKQIENNRTLVKRMTEQISHERDQKTKKEKDDQVKNFQTQQQLRNLKVLLEEMQRLSGIEECPAGDNQIKVRFVNTETSERSLYLTMTLCQDKSGHVRLEHAEVSIDSFHCTDLIAEAIKTNDVKSLITRLQDRWNMYYPIMSEIETVSESHAVDWIQDEGLVRILVGKGGTVMYTLKMPNGYPFKGEISIASTSGLPADLQPEDCRPQTGNTTLKQWVDFLEEKFGKP